MNSDNIIIETDGELVDERWGCPQCGELRMDYLAWTDGETVKCCICGCEYMLGELNNP